METGLLQGRSTLWKHVGYDPNKVLFSIHTKDYNHNIGTQKSGSLVIPTAMTEYHKYRVDWTPYAVRGYFE
jgi:hypothetical protein